MTEAVNIIDRFMRTNHLPHIWCPGCGNGIVINALIRAIDNAKLKKEEVVVVSGIGCSGRAAGYLNFCGFQPTHGRAIPFGTGVKIANPDLKVIVITGDGDCTSIGGNHFIHAARRNIDLTVIVFNNSNYGMTGGQYSPTTPLGAKTSTSPYGHIEDSFDICELAKTAGATYIARSTTYHIVLTIRYLEKAIKHKGFSVVEVICACPTLLGRFNKLGDTTQMMLQQKEQAIQFKKAQKMSSEDLKDKIIIGEIYENIQKPEYTDAYQKVIDKAQKEEN
jgi:2-oxoglutarate/2-oxoacid ferredoxin oxidoreductase subunit beta